MPTELANDGPVAMQVSEPFAMLAVGVGVRLLDRPSPRRYAEAGLFVGVACVFGRNHALYAGVGFALLVAWLSWRASRPPAPAALAGALGAALLGAAPLAWLALAEPGFVTGFWESLMFFVARGSNHPLPVPWPWRVGGSLERSVP